MHSKHKFASHAAIYRAYIKQRRDEGSQWTTIFMKKKKFYDATIFKKIDQIY